MPASPGTPISRDQIIDLEQVCARIVSVGYDNGVTPGSSDGPGRPNFIRFDWAFTASSWNLNCQDVDTGPIGPFTNWTPQLQGWADAHNAVMPDNYFAAFGFLPAPTWRYDKVTTCDPTVQFGVWTLTRDDGGIYKIYPILKQEETVIAWRYFTIAKDGTKEVHWCAPDPDNPGEYVEAVAPTWQPVEGDPPQPIPEECLVSCDFQFGSCIKDDAVSSCDTRTIDNAYCIAEVDEKGAIVINPDTGEPNKTPVVMVESVCASGEVIRDFYTQESWLAAQSNDDLVAAPDGKLVFCSSCEAVLLDCKPSYTECGYDGVTVPAKGKPTLTVDTDPTGTVGTNSGGAGGNNSGWAPSQSDCNPDGYNEPLDLAPVQGEIFQTFRYCTWKLDVPEPECNAGTVDVCFDVSLTNLGPSQGWGVNSDVRLYKGSTLCDVASDSDGRQQFQPVGATAVNKVCCKLTPAEIAAGVFLRVGVETRHQNSNDTLEREKAWDVKVDGTYEWAMDDCPPKKVEEVSICNAEELASALEGKCLQVDVKSLPDEYCAPTTYGPFCDVDPGDASDPENEIDPSVIQSDIFVDVPCDGGDSFVYTLDATGNQVDYTPVGVFPSDCDTLEPADEPLPPCPEDAQFLPVDLGGGFKFIQDNSNFVNSPTPHLTNGFNFEFTYKDASGAVVGVWQQSADPLYPNLIQTFGDQMVGCTAEGVCANHTSPKGCRAGGVANLAACPEYDPPTFPGDIQNNLSNPAQSELWASGWLIRCNGLCSSPPARVEITNSSDPAYIGAYKDLIVYEEPSKLGFRAVTCDGVYYKDCDGNDIPAPNCCPTPWEPELTCVKVVPQKTITTDTQTYCAFLDGDLTNCAAENVVEFIRVFENCIVDGKLENRTFTDYEQDGITELDSSAFTEVTVSVQCSRDDEGNLLICHESCYTYNPPVVVRPVKAVKSIRKLEVAVRQLKAVSIKTVLKKGAAKLTEDITSSIAESRSAITLLEERAEDVSAEKTQLVAIESSFKSAGKDEASLQKVAASAEALNVSLQKRLTVRAKAIEDGEAPSEPSKFVRGTCLKVIECCPCGDPENIVSQEFYVQGPNETEFTEIEPFEVTKLWTEKACDPSLDCPDDVVGLNDCTIAALNQTDCKYRCDILNVGTDRNGIGNPFQSTNFTATMENGDTYTGATYNDLVTAMSADGYTLEITPTSANSHLSTLSVIGDEELTSITYTNAQAGTVTLIPDDCMELPCGWELLAALDKKPCCDSRIVTDAICFVGEVVLGDLTLAAGQPVIRQLIFTRTYNEEKCACEDLPGEGELRYYNFVDPTMELTEQVEASEAEFSTCDPIEVSQQELCDDKGNRYLIVGLSVGANGSVVATTIYNQDGEVVGTPENLQPCPGNLNAQCGCIRNADGTIATRNVKEWTGVSEAGTKIHGGYTVGQLLNPVTLEPGQSFDCDCKDKKCTTVGGSKYAYTISGESAFPCANPTITIDGEVTELCEGGNTGPATIPTTGDICTNGGIRSQLETVSGVARCDHLNPGLLTSDDADYATELVNFGSSGDEAVNPTVAAFGVANTNQTANVMVAVRNTYPGLVGQSGTSISIQNTWHVGSGIALGALHCNADGSTTQMELISGTPSSFPGVCDGPNTTRGPVDAWGGGNNGLSQTTQFQLPGAANFNFEDVIFFTTVMNPLGDHLSGFIVEGESIAQPSGCVVDNITDLASLISGETGLDAVVVDGVLCIETDQVLGPITCGSEESLQSYDPVVTDLSKPIKADYVALCPEQMAQLACLIGEKVAEALMIDKPDEEPSTLCAADGKTAACTETATKRVFKDFSHKGGDTSAATLAAVRPTFASSSCTAFNQTFTNFASPGVQDVAGGVNTNLETWINDNLGPLGFAAVPATVADAANSNSPMPAFMDLTYPTCEAFTLDILFTPTHYSAASPLFSGVRYTFDGSALVAELIDASGNVVPTPAANTAGNLGSLPLCP